MNAQVNIKLHRTVFIILAIFLSISVAEIAECAPQDDLINAVREGKLESVKAAVKKGARVHVAAENRLGFLFGKPEYSKNGYSGQLGSGWTPIFWAVYEGHFDIVKYLVEEKNLSVNIEDDAGATPIMFAIWQNKHDLIPYLLKNGADIKEQQYGMNILMMATGSFNDDTNLLNTILNSGVSINIDDQDDDGWTALHYAIGRPKKMAFLLSKKANPNKMTSDDITPLILASKNSDIEAVKLLLSAKPDINTRDKAGMTAVAYGINNGNYEIVKLLIESGVNLDIKTSENKSLENLAREVIADEQKREIKINKISDDSVLITEGFIYQKKKSASPAKLLVTGSKNGVIQATGTNTMLLGGGDTSYSVGSEWTFDKPEISFRNAGYIYTSKYKGAKIEFREDGVLLTGLSWEHQKLKKYQDILKLIVKGE